MITSRFNPGATTKAEPKPAMYQAWLYNNISTMAELAKYTQPSNMIRKTEVRICNAGRDNTFQTYFCYIVFNMLL